MVNFYCNKIRFIHFFQIFYIFLLLVTQAIFVAVCLQSLALHLALFSVGGYNKKLNDSTSGNIKGLGETKLTVPLGASH